MNLAIFLQRVEADFKAFFASDLHEASKKFDPRRSDQKHDILIQRLRLPQIGIKVCSRA